MFAHNAVGGGVLGYDAFQEEIKYVTSPECLVILLLAYESKFKSSGDVDYFERSLLDNESFCINGTEIYSDYSGYGDSFRFINPYDDRRKIKGMMRESKLLIFDTYGKKQFSNSSNRGIL